MGSFIETLTDRTPTRRDQKQFLPVRRPAPRRPRDLFDVIGELGPKAGNELLMAVFTWADTDPRGLFYGVLGRLPYLKELEELPADYSPRGHLRRLVMSPEFRLRIVRRLLDAYPERQRLMFVHVPRCAGTDLTRRLGADNPLVPMDLNDPAKVDDEEIVKVLGGILGRVRNSRTILLAERIPLRAFLHSPMQKNDARGGTMRAWEFDSSVYRVGDKLFSVVREPGSLMLSLVNQALRDRKVGGRRPEPGSAEILEEAGKILATLPSNPICRALGEGNLRTVQPLLTTSNIELTDLDRYDRWIKAAFNFDPEPREARPPLFRRDHMSAEQLEQIRVKTSEDQLLYDRIKAALDGSGASSVVGSKV